MRIGTKDDLAICLSCLVNSFLDNKSVSYILPLNNKRKKLEELIRYSFHYCLKFGQVFITDDNTACALVLYPEKKVTTLETLAWDVRFSLFGCGVKNISKAIDREKRIKQRHPTSPFAHLWFIGTHPSKQATGKGTQLLNEVTAHCHAQNREVYLETSTIRNIAWYKNNGYVLFDELELSYKLYFFKN